MCFGYGCCSRFIDKSCSWFSYNGERIGQGRENAKKYLEERPDVMDDISNKMKEKLSPTETTDTAGEKGLFERIDD